jgi:hypothetical protein
MPSSGMLRRVTLVRTDVSEGRSVSSIKVTRISELGALAVTSSVCRLLVTANAPSSLILVTLMMDTLRPSETPFLQEPHGIKSQRTVFFTVVKLTVVKLNHLG